MRLVWVKAMLPGWTRAELDPYVGIVHARDSIAPRMGYLWSVGLFDGPTLASGDEPTESQAQQAAASYIESQVLRLARALALVDTKWISSAQQYPPIGESVLVWYSNGVLEGCYMGTIFERWRVGMYQVTKGTISHWRPLPPPPEEV